MFTNTPGGPTAAASSAPRRTGRRRSELVECETLRLRCRHRRGARASTRRPVRNSNSRCRSSRPTASQVAFIGGLMSDFDAVAGDAYRDAARTNPHPVARDVTRELGRLGRLARLGLSRRHAACAPGCRPAARRRWSTLADTPSAAQPRLGRASRRPRIACRAATNSFQSPAPPGSRRQRSARTIDTPPEIAVGPMGRWRNITHA